MILVVSGAATGAGGALALGDGSQVWDLVLAHLNYLPSVLVVLAVAALLYGTRPWVASMAWAVVGYGFLVGTIGRLLDLPQEIHNVSAFSHPAYMPLEQFEPIPVLIAISTIGMMLALMTFRRRQFNVK